MLSFRVNAYLALSSLVPKIRKSICSFWLGHTVCAVCQAGVVPFLLLSIAGTTDTGRRACERHLIFPSKINALRNACSVVEVVRCPSAPPCAMTTTGRHREWCVWQTRLKLLATVGEPDWVFHLEQVHPPADLCLFRRCLT